MKTSNFISIVRMQESHLKEVVEIAQKNNLSYWSSEDYKSEISRADSCCLIAENEQEQVVGFLASRLIMTEDYAELYNIAVSDVYKRKGIGIKLLTYLTNHCVSNSLVKINLEVRKSNRIALQFYLQQNFQQVGIRKNFYTQPEEDALTLIKFL